MTSHQSEINIGLIGHVDHGKTTLTKALSGVWTDKHSEEIKRGISIRLGYANCEIYFCKGCGKPGYTTEPKCPECGGEAKFLRRMSFVDAPGHETLMATMLSGAAIMDGAVLVIAANEDCPQPQTQEHLMALEILEVKNIVIAQNKIDLVSKEKAKENYKQIKEFVKNSIAEDAPIIPIVAHHNANVDLLIEAIEEYIPTPKRDLKKKPLMYIARSFDINKPGAEYKNLVGGVLGGSLICGKINVGDEIEVKPGYRKNNASQPLTTKVVSLSEGGNNFDSVHPGGLIAIGTELDPSLTKSDNLSGNMIGAPKSLPPVRQTLKFKVNLFERLVGRKEEIKPISKGEPLMLSAGSAVTVGVVTDPGKVEVKLKLPVCAQKGGKVAINRRIGPRWHLIGYGEVIE
ncbi:MAG: translation initiation factor IF-2 subunit gamma [Candidatus Altiarchaeales archaeon]|nr:translation initiation factor IF-2 subunit gamma [Candidatus Altiarchaeales archaeon]